MATHKKTLTISTRPSATLTNQPIWLIIDGDTDVGGRAQSDASDVRIYTPGGVELSWRKVAWEISGGACNAVLMAVAPTILSSADHHVELHYGGGAATPAYSSTLSLSGLVGAWDLETTSPADWSGNGRSGSGTGTLSSVAGKVANAVDFGGGHITVSHHADLTFTSSDFSLSAWLYIPSSTSMTGFVAEKGLIDVDGWEWFFSSSNNQYVMRTYQSGARQETVSNTISRNAWHHVEIVRSGSAVQFYLNGSAANSSSGTHVNPASSSRNLRLGKRDNDLFPLVGSMDDARIYSRARSAAEVAYHVAQTNSPGTWGGEVAFPATGGPAQGQGGTGNRRRRLLLAGAY